VGSRKLMVQPTQENRVSRSPYSRRNADHPWLWVGLMGGSVAVHAVLVMAAFPFFDRLMSPSLETSSIPVEWVELPPIDRPISQEQPQPVPEATPPEPAPQTSEPPPQKIVGDITGQAGTIQPLPQTEQTPIGYSPEARSVEEIPVPAIPDPLPAQPTPPATSQPPETVEDATQNPAQSSAQPPQAAANEPVNEFPTIPIDRPPPDLSERLDIPPEPIDPSTLSRTDINTEAPTAVFMAFLALIPAPVAGEPAPPPSEITSRNISDPATSSCISFINPELLRSLETPIVANIALTPTGEVAQVELPNPTDNPAYNELAECVVRSWEFNLAPDSSLTDSSTPTLIPLQVQLIITRQPPTTTPLPDP
jgi:hypothetical protein